MSSDFSRILFYDNVMEAFDALADEIEKNVDGAKSPITKAIYEVGSKISSDFIYEYINDDCVTFVEKESLMTEDHLPYSSLKHTSLRVYDIESDEHLFGDSEIKEEIRVFYPEHGYINYEIKK